MILNFFFNFFRCLEGLKNMKVSPLRTSKYFILFVLFPQYPLLHSRYSICAIFTLKMEPKSSWFNIYTFSLSPSITSIKVDMGSIHSELILIWFFFSFKWKSFIKTSTSNNKSSSTMKSSSLSSYLSSLPSK